MSTALKIVIIGPTKVGKTVITNTISEFSNVVPQDYRPTVGCRILECEREFSDDQIKNTNYLKNNNISKCKIQLWDTSGDRKFENCWPAIQQDVSGIIIVVDSKNSKFDNILDEWVNGFCKNLKIDNIICFSYTKEEEKIDIKQKTSHQFPKLNIVEVTNDLNSLFPHFNKFILNLLSNK